MNDHVSRSDVIRLLQEEPQHQSLWPYREYLKSRVKELETVKKLETRTGSWVMDDDSVRQIQYICTSCGVSQRVDTANYKPTWKYCPLCGSYNEKTTDEVK